MKEKTALIIGRFQPFHNGHLEVLRHIARQDDVKDIVIGIGSSNLDNLPDNPFTSNERKEMIYKSLDRIKSPREILDIPDIYDDQKWPDHVRSIVPNFDLIYSGNPWVEGLFKSTEIEVRPLLKIGTTSATEVRRRMYLSQDWRSLVPDGTRVIIDLVNGVNRIKSLHQEFLRLSLTVDIIVEYKNEGIVLIQRKSGKVYGDRWALPGGFVNYGLENAKQAAVRELREETGLVANPEFIRLFGEYSDPQRDLRCHTASLVFSTHIDKGIPKAEDDAQDIGVFPLNKLPNLAFDHNKIVRDYRQWRNG